MFSFEQKYRAATRKCIETLALCSRQQSSSQGVVHVRGDVLEDDRTVCVLSPCLWCSFRAPAPSFVLCPSDAACGSISCYISHPDVCLSLLSQPLCPQRPLRALSSVLLPSSPPGRLSPVSVHFSFLTSLSCSCVFVWPFTPRAYTRRLGRTSCLPVHPARRAPRDRPAAVGGLSQCLRVAGQELTRCPFGTHCSTLGCVQLSHPVPSVHTPVLAKPVCSLGSLPFHLGLHGSLLLKCLATAVLRPVRCLQAEVVQPCEACPVSSSSYAEPGSDARGCFPSHSFCLFSSLKNTSSLRKNTGGIGGSSVAQSHA